MPLPHSKLIAGLLLGLAAGAVVPATAQTMSMSMPVAPAAEQPFLMENNTAMAKMMAAMEIKPTGDIDRDFVAMMAPHHQGAIDMAQAVLRYGKNEQIRRIAQEIIVEQLQEIAAMHLALGEPPPPSAPAPTMPSMPDMNTMQ
ncbi:DUF305 domain-containing protein [Dongia sedimenti]|uniref:DUF305 domain-containing protein n=1 Tax=Dongia sedimenti TaxID=3064282 RepID=A0ABU0YGN7_9PROT|nr:DUF305 domain-containing protein [Rhodospirillaceae bacterium R-7]